MHLVVTRVVKEKWDVLMHSINNDVWTKFVTTHVKRELINCKVSTNLGQYEHEKKDKQEFMEMANDWVRILGEQGMCVHTCHLEKVLLYLHESHSSNIKGRVQESGDIIIGHLHLQHFQIIISISSFSFWEDYFPSCFTSKYRPIHVSVQKAAT